MRKINTGDVFKTARLLKNTDVMDTVRDTYNAVKEDGADKGSIWMDAAMKVIASCTSQQAEEQLYDLMSGICENKPEDIKNRSLDDLIKDIRRICEENDVANFLRSASDFAEKL